MENTFHLCDALPIIGNVKYVVRCASEASAALRQSTEERLMAEESTEELTIVDELMQRIAENYE